jgi:hypothetical protein
MQQLIPPSANRIPAQPGDAHQLLHPATPPLQGQQADKLAAMAFIERRENPVDGPVLFRTGTIRMRSTGHTITGMNRGSASFFHWRFARWVRFDNNLQSEV